MTLPQFDHGVPHPKDVVPFAVTCRIETEQGHFVLSDAVRQRLGREGRRDPAPVTELCSVLWAKRRAADAEPLLDDLVKAHPGSEPVAESWAQCASERGDWHEAARRWKQVAARFPRTPLHIVRIAFCLKVAGLAAEADVELGKGVRAFPGDLRLALEYAAIATFRGEPALAYQRFGETAERFPRHPGCVAGQAEALLAMGRFAEAESLLESKRPDFGEDFGFRLQSAWSATRLGHWTTAFRRWATCIERNPREQSVNDGTGQAIEIWRLATAGTDQTEVERAMPPEIAARAGVARGGAAGGVTSLAARTPDTAVPPAESARELMIGFEGLGNMCEFGLVQRRFGAEPIGLLRWSLIDAERLADLLDRRFQGVGDPENLRIRIEREEYIVGDGRFFEMHTFINADHISPEALKPKMAQRMRFLGRKLLADLDEGGKLFVHKPYLTNSTDQQLELLSRTLAASYPNATLLTMRVADADHPPGSVSQGPDRIMIGYLSRFLRQMLQSEILFEEWREVCANAAAQWQRPLADPVRQSA